jgi:hypothetical protein
MISTIQERERFVSDLYYNQGKNTREIAQEARMSFSVIGAILKKATEENETSKEQTERMSQAAKAYKLFSDGKSPVDVAIELNLRQTEVTEFYREYWNLKQLYDLSRVYEEIKGDIHSFVNLYRLIKSAGMNSPQVIRLLTIANNHLPSVEQRCENLNREVASLEGDKRNSTMILQELSDQISELSNMLDSCSLFYEQEKGQIHDLHYKKIQLEALVNDFQNNNEEYIKIIRAVEEKVLNVSSNVKVLLRYALLSMTESIRNEPERFRSIFYNISPSIIDYSNSSNGQDYIDSCMYWQQQPPQQNWSPDSDTEANAAIIIDEAEQLFNKLIKDCVNKTIANLKTTNLASDSKPSSLSLSPRKELSDVQKDSTQKLAAAYTYRKEEEHTFIQSEEFDNENQNN